MHVFLKISAALIAVTIVTVAVTVPLVFHFRNENNEVSLTSLTTATTTITRNSSSTSTMGNTIGNMTNTTTIPSTRVTNATTATANSITNVSSTTTIVTTAMLTNASMTTNVITTAILIPTSQYSSALTTNSQKLCLSTLCDKYNYYAQAIQINVATTGTYTIQSNSSIDTYGYIYNDSVDATYPNQNLLASDDQSGGSNQFMFTITLQSMMKYILVVSTYSVGITGSFSIIGTGPTSLSFTQINMSATQIFGVQSQYSSVLTNNSQKLCRLTPCNSYIYYAQAFQINVTTTGFFIIKSNSSINTYGYIYKDDVDATNINQNLFISDDNNGGSNQFMITITLQSMMKYILVVSTALSKVTGPFSIIATGPALLGFTEVNMSVTTVDYVFTQYVSMLTNTSQVFCRGLPCDTYIYYAQAFKMNVTVNGSYILKPNNGIDTYGYIYNDSVNPTFPTENLLMFDDNSGGSSQFSFTMILESTMNYILVVSTASPKTKGYFTMTAYGPGSVDFYEIMMTVPPDTYIQSQYLSNLTYSSKRFCRGPCVGLSYYYEVLQLNISITGSYYITSASSLDTYGYLYSNNFNSRIVDQNLITSSDDDGGSSQLMVSGTFQATTKYFLVVTTYSTNRTGSFSIYAKGIGPVGFSIG